MGLPKLKTRISVADYLTSEPTSPVKREFVEGHVYAMAGGSDNHNRIVGAIMVAMNTHLRDSNCEPFFGDIKVRVSETVYYYPDVLVSCEENPENQYFRNQPILIVEVISPSTERVDRSEKLLYYLQMPSLQEYVLVDQRSVNIEVHRRQANGGWLKFYFDESDDAFDLASIDLKIPIAYIYRRVQFQQDANPDG